MDKNIPTANEARDGEPVCTYDRKLSYRDNYKETFTDSLKENLGYYVIAEFCGCGTAMYDRKDGILYAIGTDYITIYQEDDDSYTMCDLESLKFITFYETKTKPRNLRCIRR